VGWIGAKPACKDSQAALEHRAEKWVPVFGKKDAATRNYSIEPDSEIRFDAVGLTYSTPG